jgi:glycosyltransferase involved in cell wall biosynthesis
MPKILFIVHHRKDRSPGQRFRFEQYFSYLEQNGFHITFSNLLNKQDDAIFYAPGNYLGKFWILLKAFFIRIFDIYRATNHDIVFIYREGFITGTTFFERAVKTFTKAKIVFDFDDSIWITTISESNKNLAFLKNPKKTDIIISLADMVFVGNNYLADYARKLNPNVKLVPTTVDTLKFDPPNKVKYSKNNKICIGWSGSFSTIEHFETAIPALQIIKEKFTDKVYFKLIGDENYTCKQLNLQGIAWSSQTEVAEMAEFDIGIMPLPDTDFTRGKCGLKGLTYMALEIATIMSPVGVNKDIIVQGENGFLADTTNEWVEKISLLIEDATLREKLGKAGRKTVLEKYSIEANKDKYVEFLSLSKLKSIVL